jgi:hypothetical protein
MGALRKRSGGKMKLSGMVIAAILSALAWPAAAQELPRVSDPNASLPKGRYQILFSPFTERNMFMLDSETGEVWQLQAFNSLIGEPLVWNIMPRVNNDDDMARVVAQFGKKPGVKQIAPASIAPLPR